MRHSFRYRLSVLALAAAALAACSNDKSSDALSDTFATTPIIANAPQSEVDGLLKDTAVDLETEERTAKESPAVPSQSGTDATVPAALTNRKIIRNATITVEVPDVPKALAQLRSLITASGGFLATEQANYGSTDQVVVSFRVPVDRFDSALNRLGAIGSVLSTDITSQEVTNQYRDLESRLRSKKVSAERLRELITKAVKASDILEIETELSDREAEIESMQGQLNVLSDQSSLSTVTVRVVGKGDGTVVEIRKPQDPSFTRAWRNSVSALGDIAQALAAATGALLPFLPLLAAAAALLVTVRRRRARRSHGKAVTPGTAPVTVGRTPDSGDTPVAAGDRAESQTAPDAD